MHRLRAPSVGLLATVTVLTVVTAAVVVLQLGDASSDPRGDHCRGSCHLPPAEGDWSYQLQGRPALTAARVYDVDGFDTPKTFITRLHAQRRYAICYLDAGTFEDWRPDRGRFSVSLLGQGNGWHGERWLDIRKRDALLPIMRARARMCRRKGFDAVEWDNIDGFANHTGFPITARDQLAYNRRLAAVAHRAGLAVGLKNELGQVKRLVRRFDFSIVEQCFEFRECARLRPFLRANKPVLEVEYNIRRADFCPQARRLGISAISARSELDRPGTPC
jgi:hypothetical protein